MSTATSTRYGNLSKFDLVLLALHCLGALATGVFGFIDVDPDWAALQRIVVAMLVGLWLGGILIMTVIAKRLTSQWARSAVLLVGPFIGIAVFVVRSRFG
jgi:hypothetical protein